MQNADKTRLCCRGGSIAKIQTFLVFSTCFLYLIAAGLFSRAFWCFETQQWNKVIGGDAAELGDGPGSYDIDRSVWHVNVSAKQVPFSPLPFFGLLPFSHFFLGPAPQTPTICPFFHVSLLSLPDMGGSLCGTC